MHDIPVGIKFFQILGSRLPSRLHLRKKELWFKSLIFGLTFVSYTCYHATRKPLSVVRTYFNRSCESLVPPTNIIIDDSNRFTWCDWAPFYGPFASTLLGTLDSSFLFAYAVAMFLSGFVAERVSLRYFLAVGMISSGFSCYLMGIAHSYDIHSIWYFVFVQIFGGIVQTTGWPGVVTVMGNWFGKSKRGLIFGLWNSHTSVGNIVGTLIASYFLNIDWGLSFMIPGVVIAVVGFIIFLFLVEYPVDVGCSPPDLSNTQRNTIQYIEDPSESDQTHVDSAESDTELLQPLNPTNSGEFTSKSEEKAIGFSGALKIPGVMEFSLCLFFAKLICYTMLNWLPSYIKSSTKLSGQWSSYLSVLFDVGGLVGGIVTGIICDYSGMSATTCSIMLILSIPLLFLYNLYGAINLGLNITMLVLVGFFVNGPYALITTAVSAELGTHHSLSSNAKALATVTAIIDGTGSIGAAVGPSLAGIFQNFGWSTVFYMMILSDIIALIMLGRLVKNEFQTLRSSTIT